MSTCTLCGYGLTGDRSLWTTCQLCQTNISRLMVAIEDDWPRLSDALEPTRGHSGPRVSGTPSRPLPIGAKILDLIGPMGVPTRLYFGYASLAVARRIQPATMPPGADARVRLALYGIRKHLPWAVQGHDMRGLTAALDGIAHDLRRVVSEADDSPTIPCPAELPGDVRCTGRLRYDPDRKTAACRTCRTELSPSEWLGYWVKLGQPDLV